jgi:hypothetical protein
MNDGEENPEEMLRVLHERQSVRSKLKAACEAFSNQPEISNIESHDFSQNINILNELASKAEHPRELQIDAIALKHLSTAAKTQAIRLNDMSRRYSFDTIAQQLAHFHHPGRQTLDWTALGMTIMTIVSFIPPHDTMLGAIDKTIKERRQGVRKRAMNNENDDLIDGNLASKPTEQTQQDTTVADDSAALKRSAVQLDFIRKMMDKDKNEIDLIDLLVDPSDSVQTIENFFDYSFLLKDKKVAEGIVEGDDLPKVVIADPNTLDAADKKQMILAINMADLGHLMSEMRKHHSDNAEVHPFHRSSELYQCHTIPDQIKCLEQQAQKRQRR